MNTFAYDWTAGAIAYHKQYDASSKTILSHLEECNILSIFNSPVAWFKTADPAKVHNFVDAWQTQLPELHQNMIENLIHL